MSVDLTVRSQLQKLISDLGEVSKMAEDISKEFQKGSKVVSESLGDQAKKTEKNFDRLKKFTRNLFTDLKNDFKALASVQSLVAGMKMSEQFRGSLKQAVNLYDAIRKLGPTLNISGESAGKFASKVMKALGDVGIESDAAVEALKGLAETPVRGEEALMEYAKTAGQIGMITGERGQEGEIAKGMAGVVTARGMDAGDVKNMRGVAESLAKIRVATGMGATQSLKAMETLFRQMPADFRKKFTSRMMEGLAVAETVAGKGSTDFIQQYLGKGLWQRAGLDARKYSKLFTEKGLNIEALKEFGKKAKELGSGDLRLGMQAMGVVGDEAAEGAARLVEALDRVSATQDKLKNTTIDLNKLQEETMTTGEAFNSVLAKTKAVFSGVLQPAIGMLRGGMVKAQKTTGGAIAASLGMASLAAILTGRGLGGIGRAMGGGGMIGGLARAGAAETLTGRQVQPVYVTNASEIGGGIGGGMGGGMLGKVGMVGAAAAGGLMLGDYLNRQLALDDKISNLLVPASTGKLSKEEADQAISEGAKLIKPREGMPEGLKVKIELYSEKENLNARQKQGGTGIANAGTVWASSKQ